MVGSVPSPSTSVSLESKTEDVWFTHTSHLKFWMYWPKMITPSGGSRGENKSGHPPSSLDIDVGTLQRRINREILGNTLNWPPSRKSGSATDCTDIFGRFGRILRMLECGLEHFT